MMRVRPLDWKGSRQFVVSHQNITEGKLIEEQIHELSVLDALTEISNRRYFNYFLDEEWRRAQRFQHPVSLILFDIDCFKPFNDNYGHMAGDECLKKISAALNEFARRPGDLAARYGGEEFAIILGNTDAEGATKIAKEVVVGDLNRLEEHLFEKSISEFEASKYQDERVIVKGCSDFFIPRNAYYLLAEKLKPVVKSLMFGEPCSTVPVYKRKS